MRFVLALAVLVGCNSSKTRDEPAPAAPSAALTIERDRVTIDSTSLPDHDGAIDRATLEIKLRGRSGTVPLALAADAPFGRLLQVLDILFQLGLDGELDVGRGGPQPIPRPIAAAAPLDDAPTLVLAISTDAIYLGADQVTRLADVPPGDDIPALATAIASRAQRPTRLAFQADNATPGAIIVRALGTARRAGITELPLLRAVRPPVPLPEKRPE